MGQDNRYKTDVMLGEKYLDEQTGIEGTAVAVTFFQHACERVSLELVVAGKIEEYTFDAPRLTAVETGETMTASAPGGPDRASSHVRRGPLSR